MKTISLILVKNDHLKDNPMINSNSNGDKNYVNQINNFQNSNYGNKYKLTI